MTAGLLPSDHLESRQPRVGESQIRFKAGLTDSSRADATLATGANSTIATGEPHARIMLGGYGQDREERILADPDCHVIGHTADGQGHALLRHDCAATGGTSGAPLLAQTPDGAWRAIGIQIAGNARGAGGIAIPLPLP